MYLVKLSVVDYGEIKTETIRTTRIFENMASK